MLALLVITATALHLSVDTTSLDSLIALAQRRNPDVRAAAARLDAARARIGPAGARPDPTLMVGVQDLPYHTPGYADDFTMNVVRVTQTIPFPGKRGLAERAAAEDAEAVRAEAEEVRLDIARDVRKVYYELAYTQCAMDVVTRNQSILASLLQTSQTRYEVGSGTQADVLRARVEMTRLGDQAATLAADVRAARARLNAVLDQPSDTPVDSAIIPEAIVRLAVADSATHVRFVSAALGAPPADSPLPAVDSLQALAIVHSPMLQVYDSRIVAQERRLAFSRKASLPDVDVALEYDQRPHFPDYISAFISVPLPLQKGRKQNEEVAVAQAELAALRADRDAEISALRATVATLASDAERERTQLALDLAGVLPEARATLQSATASYMVGRVDFSTLMDAQAALFNYELSYDRTLSEFATTLAELQRVIGTEVVR